ncbi:MAG: RNA polymerase sigma factor [Candidatus Latescibacteria bacterium]|nr:RNA polymerase sigma factor [Candidatus Latescibacterota bacterium]
MLQRNWRAYAERASWGPTDKALVDRLRRGDTGAFDVLYDRHHPRLYGCLRRMIGDPERARDLVHDVFLRLIEKSETIDTRRPFYRWLYSVAHNLSCSELRHGQVRRRTGDTVELELRHQVSQTQPQAPRSGPRRRTIPSGVGWGSGRTRPGTTQHVSAASRTESAAC